jgi:S1-C subfamily serine protease
VIVDAAGYVVTNFHVVHGAAGIRVSLSDGRVLPARIVGSDPLTDLAVLKIDGDKFLAADWGDSDQLEAGALVWAVGSPFGLQRTITAGIVSAKHRDGVGGDAYRDFLQTDAAVNPGNSGGPLVDARGRVVGINTAILGDVYQGVSFAIPSRVARPIYQRLRDSGQVARGWLGVSLREVTEEDAQRLNLPKTSGAFVAQVIDEDGVPCPARDAGLQSGDVVIRWNRQAVGKPAELIRAVAMTGIGATVPVTVIRQGREITLNVKVAERPPYLNS